VGEVWWLFDQGRPYLAEVFKEGEVPASRLPHLDRSSVKGRHVARLLDRHSTVKLLPRSARLCLFTAWCAPSVLVGHDVPACSYVPSLMPAFTRRAGMQDQHRGGCCDTDTDQSTREVALDPFHSGHMWRSGTRC
jgi:hypothetical protein